jgi:hypothetical protein
MEKIIITDVQGAAFSRGIQADHMAVEVQTPDGPRLLCVPERAVKTLLETAKRYVEARG